LDALLLSKGNSYSICGYGARRPKAEKGNTTEFCITHISQRTNNNRYEEKDLKMSLHILDHDVGNGRGKINQRCFAEAFEKDNKLALSVKVERRNLVDRPEILPKWSQRPEALG